MIMQMLVTAISVGAVVWAGSSSFAQVVGPARRAAAGAADAVGAPGVGQRIENREQMRDVDRAAVNPNAAARANARAVIAGYQDPWRYVYHNNGWWYYSPQNSWMYYRNNAWSNYNANVSMAPNTYVQPRYRTGYRGMRAYNYYGPNANFGPPAQVPTPDAARMQPGAGGAGVRVQAGPGGAAVDVDRAPGAARAAPHPTPQRGGDATNPPAPAPQGQPPADDSRPAQPPQ
jgi:hypothetical protein